ncbi:hypothetical protein RintRC_3970 [Richelia intracellularis]|nr:hypothetical protein RintRC_3970 [Richelia intracellularis]
MTRSSFFAGLGGGKDRRREYSQPPTVNIPYFPFPIESQI